MAATLGGLAATDAMAESRRSGDDMVRMDPSKNGLELFGHKNFEGRRIVIWPVTQFQPQKLYEVPGSLFSPIVSSLRYSLPQGVEVDLHESMKGGPHITLAGSGQITRLSIDKWDFNDKAKAWQWRHVGRRRIPKPVVTGTMRPVGSGRPAEEFKGASLIRTGAQSAISATILILMRAARFSPLTFALGVTVDLAVHLILEYALDLQVRCNKCGTKAQMWLCGEPTDIICNDCRVSDNIRCELSQ